MGKEFFDQHIAQSQYTLRKQAFENCREKRSFRIARPTLTLVLPNKKAEALVQALQETFYFKVQKAGEGIAFNIGEKHARHGLPLELACFEGSAVVVEQSSMALD